MLFHQSNHTVLLSSYFAAIFLGLVFSAHLIAADIELSIESLLKKRQISEECLKELISLNYDNGEIFDIKNYLSKPLKEKECFPIGSDEDLSQWLEEKSKGSLDDWEYVGSWDKYHVIRTELNGDTWRRHSIHLFEWLDQGIHITDTICGLKNAEVCSAKLQGNRLQFVQPACGAEIFNLTHSELPNFLLDQVDIHDYKPIVLGTYETTIDEAGKFGSAKPISYGPYLEGLIKKKLILSLS